MTYHGHRTMRDEVQDALSQEDIPALDFAIRYMQGQLSVMTSSQEPGLTAGYYSAYSAALALLKDIRAAYVLTDEAWDRYFASGGQPWPVE